MANLAKTQAEWTQIFREFGLFLKVLEIANFNRKRCQYVRNQIVEEFEEPGKIGTWTLAGVVIGTNTDHQGVLYGKLTDETPGAGQARVQLYSDSARTALVAQGDAADGATATLVEQNSSGLSGTVKLGTVSANDNDWRLTVFQDFLIAPAGVFALTPPAQASLAAFIELLATCASNLESLESTALSEVETNFILTRLQEFLRSTSDGLVISQEEDVDSDSGEITVIRTGLLAELVDAMNDETTAAAQKVLKNTAAASSVTADPANVGAGTLTVTAVKQYVEPGTVVVKCTDETIGEEQFEVSEIVSETNEVIDAANDLSIGSSYESVALGISMLLSRTPTETGDNNNQLSNYVVNGLSEDNSDGGKLYYSLTDVAGTRIVEVYSTSDHSTTKVAAGSRVGDGTVTLLEANGSGLSGSVDIVYVAPDVDITLDMEVFKEFDEFRFSLTNDKAGKLQTVVGREWKVELPNAAAGAETIVDGVVAEGLSVLMTDHAA